MRLTDSKRVRAALEALDLHAARETDLQRRYQFAVEAAENLARELGAAVCGDSSREQAAAAELATARAHADLLGVGVQRAEQERLRLQDAVSLARAADLRERAAELRREHDAIVAAVEKHYAAVEKLEGMRPPEMPSGSNSDNHWREIASLESSAAGLEADPASGYRSVVESLQVEAAAG